MGTVPVVFDAIVQLVVAPGLVGAATLAARRWGEQTGGLVSAFPAIVGPVLLVAAHAHGAAFAARAAGGTLLGMVALSGFAAAYGRAAMRLGWPASLAVAWAVAGALAVLAGTIPAGPAAALALAGASLAAAHRALPRGHRPAGERLRAPRGDLAMRLALTVALVVALSAAATRLGPVVGGVLAALPVLASVLAVFTHAQHGAAAVADLLRGMLTGLAGFVVFCALVAVLVVPAGVLIAFPAAALAALGVQAAAVRPPRALARAGDQDRAARRGGPCAAGSHRGRAVP